MAANEVQSDQVTYDNNDREVVNDSATEVSIDTYRGIVQFNVTTTDVSSSEVSNTASGNHMSPIELEMTQQDFHNITINDEGEARDLNMNNNDTGLLPSYEESQREHENRDGELPPPYESDLPIDSARPSQSSTVPSHRQTRRRTVVSYGDFPTRTRCKSCGQEVITRLRHVPGTLTFIMMILILLVGGIFFCCLIPLCIHGLMDVQHRCPECNTVLGYYHRLG